MRIEIRKINVLFSLLAMSIASIGYADEATLFKASKVYTLNGPPLSPGQVLVVNGKIKAVGSTIDVGTFEPTTIDSGPGSVLMPGLVDAYSQTALDRFGRNEISDEVTPNFKTVDSIDWSADRLKHQHLAGTTTMCVCPGTENVFSGVAAIIKTGTGEKVLNDDGPLVASLCSDPARGNRARLRPDSIFVRQPTNRMGVVWIMRSTFDKSIRQQNDSANSSTDLSVVAESANGNRPLMLVCRISHDLTSAATLADEFDLKPILVGGQEAYKVKEMVAERNYPVILQRLRIDSTRGAENSELIWNLPGVLADAGITFALSGGDLLEQARFAHRNGLDADQCLASITTTPAKLLGLQDKIGQIKVGQDADMVVLNGDPLEITTSITNVIVDGESSNFDKETK